MDKLPNLWLRAHPYGDVKNQDSHREHFDRRTKFYDDLLPTVPISYYHNFTPDGKPMGDPVAVGITSGRQYINPDTGEVDGRWDKAEFFDDVPLDIKQRIANAIENGTLRASPTVVPDFHRVDRDGHISHWLTGSIAVFDAEGFRQPANPRAIGIAQMKALFDQAHLDFPSQLERKNVMADLTPQGLYTEIKNWLKAKLKVKDDEADQADEADDEPLTPEQMKEWGAVFEDDEEDTDETDGKAGKRKAGSDPENSTEPIDENSDDEEIDELRARHAELFGKGTQGKQSKQTNGEASPKEQQMADKTESELRLEYDNKMKAMLAQNNELKARLDRADIEAWIDKTVNAEGVKVTPAERDEVITLALALKASAHPTMKTASGQDTTLFDAFKQTIEARNPAIPLNEMKFNEINNGVNDASKVDPKRKAELLATTDLGAALLKEKNGKH